jgi:hypothetical protein
MWPIASSSNGRAPGIETERLADEAGDLEERLFTYTMSAPE